jgi:hypothetical protein
MPDSSKVTKLFSNSYMAYAYALRGEEFWETIYMPDHDLTEIRWPAKLTGYVIRDFQGRWGAGQGRRRRLVEGAEARG